MLIRREITFHLNLCHCLFTYQSTSKKQSTAYGQAIPEPFCIHNFMYKIIPVFIVCKYKDYFFTL